MCILVTLDRFYKVIIKGCEWCICCHIFLLFLPSLVCHRQLKVISALFVAQQSTLWLVSLCGCIMSTNVKMGGQERNRSRNSGNLARECLLLFYSCEIATRIQVGAKRFGAAEVARLATRSHNWAENGGCRANHRDRSANLHKRSRCEAQIGSSNRKNFIRETFGPTKDECCLVAHWGAEGSACRTYTFSADHLGASLGRFDIKTYNSWRNLDLLFIAPDKIERSWMRSDGSQPLQIPRIEADRRKVMAVVFWDAEGLVHLKLKMNEVIERGGAWLKE